MKGRRRGWNRGWPVSHFSRGWLDQPFTAALSFWEVGRELETRSLSRFFGHQAIADQAEAGRPAVLAEQAQVGETVGVAGEDILAVVAALGDMVGESGSHHPGESGHANRVSGQTIPSQEKVETRSLSRVFYGFFLHSPRFFPAY